MQLYQDVTTKIISKLEQGIRPWEKPYNGGLASLPKRHNHQSFSGANIIVLWLAGYGNPYWMTYGQAKKLGGQVRAKEKHTKALMPLTRKIEDENKVITTGFKPYPVFNAQQIDGLPSEYYPKEDTFLNPDKPVDWIDEVVSNTGAVIEQRDGTPCYIPSIDKICMPAWDDFKSGADYYCTILHEITHWTGHKSREDRLQVSNKKGYAFEELVAELGAAFMMADLGITPTVRDDHASYIGSWIQALGNDHRYIFDAAKYASKAVQYVTSAQQTETRATA